MFEIEYKGANALTINTKNIKLVSDPKLSIVGLKDIALNGAVELLTEERFGLFDKNSKLTIDSPGEFGISDFDIKGIPAQRHIDSKDQGLKSVIYRIKIGDVRIGLLGNVDKNLSDAQLEDLGLLDILILPVGGGGYTLDTTDAANIVRLISPKVVIPIHYAEDSLNYEVPQDPINLFIGEIGVQSEVMLKYKVKQPLVASAPLQVIELRRA